MAKWLLGFFGFSSRLIARPSGTKFDHSVALGIADLVAENARAPLEGERSAIEVEFSVENVVAQDERRAGVAEKFRADEEGLGDSFRLWLRGVFDPDPEPGAIAEIILEHRQVFRGGNDQHSRNPPSISVASG